MNVAPASWPAVAWTSRSTLVHDELPIHAVQALAAWSPTLSAKARKGWNRGLSVGHRNSYAFFARRLLRQLIPRVSMARHADARIVVQHPCDAAGGVGGAVGHGDLPGVE